MAVREVVLKEIRADVAAQPRAAMLTDKVAEYAERMKEGDEFAAPILFYDGKVYWLADGFHRVAAAMSVGIEKLTCLIKDGGLREAILHSCGANATHGIQRTNEDKRRAVMKMLTDKLVKLDDSGAAWSDREIARRCKVTHPFVAKLKADTGNVSSMERTFTHPKSGKPAVMNTANIGKRPAATAPAPKPEAAVVELPPAKKPEPLSESEARLISETWRRKFLELWAHAPTRADLKWASHYIATESAA
jgi:hypothetical protein